MEYLKWTITKGGTADVRFEEILDNYLVEPPKGAGDTAPEPLASLAPQRDRPDFGNIPESESGLDCSHVYSAAGVSSDAPMPVEKALALIERLPEDIPVANRRVVVRMTMETMGATTRDVLADAAAKIWALNSYFEAACEGVAEASKEVRQRIEDFRTQIAELTLLLARYEGRRAAIESSASGAIDGIRRVVEFFAVPAREHAKSAAAPTPAADPVASDTESLNPADTAPPPDDPPAEDADPKPAGKAIHYDPIRRPNPEGDELEMPDLSGDAEKGSGFWQSSTTHKSPDTAEEAQSAFYTPNGEVQRHIQKKAS